MKAFSIKRVTTICMLAAMVVISTMIKFDYGSKAMVHLGSAAIYTAGLVFGSVNAGLAGAIGSSVFDLLMGFSDFTIWSIVIKGVAGFTVGYIYYRTCPVHACPVNRLIKAIIACFVATVITLIGYLIAWTNVLGSLQEAYRNIPSSLLTSAVGIVVALPLSAVMRKVLSAAKLIQ